jgi:hypothetical protein
MAWAGEMKQICASLGEHEEFVHFFELGFAPPAGGGSTPTEMHGRTLAALQELCARGLVLRNPPYASRLPRPRLIYHQVRFLDRAIFRQY